MLQLIYQKYLEKKKIHNMVAECFCCCCFVFLPCCFSPTCPIETFVEDKNKNQATFVPVYSGLHYSE